MERNWVEYCIKCNIMKVSVEERVHRTHGINRKRVHRRHGRTRKKVHRRHGLNRSEWPLLRPFAGLIFLSKKFVYD